MSYELSLEDIHSRLREICTDHPADISKRLAQLVKDGLLVPDGVGQGMVYDLPWQSNGSVFGREVRAGTNGLGSAVTPEHGPLPPELDTIPPELTDLPPELGQRSAEPSLVYFDWTQVDPALRNELAALARPVRERKRVAPAVLNETILRLCRGRYLGRRVLANLLGRNADDLLKRTLSPLVADGRHKQAYPSSRDPRQAYTRNSESDVVGES